MVQQLKGIYIGEFARTYFETHDIESYTLSDVEFIYKQQVQIENHIIKNNPSALLVIDSSFITAKIWCQDKFGQTPSWVVEGIVGEQTDLFLLCEIDIPWISDSLRKNEHNRMELYQAFKQELVARNKLFKTIHGIHQQRLDLGVTYLDDFINSNT